MNEKVSIIIPTYNRSNYQLERAVKSAVNQTYKNIEIIVVDDNANNLEERKKTREIVKKYNILKYIENGENLGGALTRNKGIQYSSGKYIAFLDDDDEFFPCKIAEQIKLILEKKEEGKNVAMVYCYKNIIDSNNKIVWVSDNINYEGNCLFEQLKDCIETTSTWLCLKESLIDVGCFEDVKAHQDNILLTKLLGAGYEIYRVPKVLLNFYLHNGKGITQRNKKYLDYTYAMLDFKKKYYSKFNSNQLEEIYYYNSSLLMKIFYENKMYIEFKNELKKILSNNKLRKHTIRLIEQYFILLIKRK